MEFARRIKALSPSATLEITNKSKELKAQGVDVISLASGEPDFEPSFEIKEASIQAIRDGNAHYTDVSGIGELKSLIVEKLRNENKLNVTEKNILVTHGAKYGLYLSFQALVEEGDEVIVFSPYWVSYIDQIKLAGGIPKIIETSEEDGFQIDFDVLEKSITSRVKGIVINSPCNPSGVIISKDDLERLGELAYKNGLFVISDEVYEYFAYDKEHISLASLSPKYLENVITINGFSKSFAIPGWRVGYVVANEDVIKKLSAMQSHSASNPNNIAQIACIEGIKSGKSFVKKMVNEYRERRDYIMEALTSIHGIRCVKPDGAFYVFPNIKYYLGKEICGKVPNDSIEFAQILIEKAHISVVPGIAFGKDGYIRISYCKPLSQLQQAVKRLKEILDA